MTIDKHHATMASVKVYDALAVLGLIPSADAHLSRARDLLSDALIEMHQANIPVPATPRDPLAPSAPSTKGEAP